MEFILGVKCCSYFSAINWKLGDNGKNRVGSDLHVPQQIGVYSVVPRVEYLKI